MDEFDIMFSKNISKYTIGGINRDLLGKELSKYALNKMQVLELGINKIK